MIKYIALDTEHGGFAEQSSLLTACFILIDKDFNIIDKLELAIKPDKNEPYYVTAEALSVNGINLVEHDKIAVTKSIGAQQLIELLKKHTNNGADKLIPIGHNVGHDLDFIDKTLLSKKNYSKYITYRVLDTGAIAQFMRLTGKIPESVSGSLTALAEHFGIDFKDRAHTAESDTEMCIQVLKKMTEL